MEKELVRYISENIYNLDLLEAVLDLPIALRQQELNKLGLKSCVNLSSACIRKVMRKELSNANKDYDM